MQQPGPFALEARKSGKSARTRARLMDAATGIFARQGFQAASVNEIARAAEVANGTFYLHFKDKEDIAAAIITRIAGDVTRQIDDAMADITDAVQRVSCGTRRFISFAGANADWGLAFFNAMWFFQSLREQVIRYLRADLELGQAQGKFTVTVDDFLIDMFGSMTLAALFGQLRGTADADAGSRVAELQLRMLGVDPALAKSVAWAPMAPLQLSIQNQINLN
jgi:AcrR family transcriptional regulator